MTVTEFIEMFALGYRTAMLVEDLIKIFREEK
jgi:hypothetical protein